MIKDKIKRGDKIIGTHLTMGNFWVADIFGMSDIDYVWIDTEHSPMYYTALLECITILKAYNKATFVRTQIDDFNHTKRILEMGADGIIFPMVETAEQAEECIKYTYYPPTGIRGFGPNHAVEYGKTDIKKYIEKENEFCRFIQIETPKAVENLESILKNDNIDGFIIGPCDMAMNCGELNNIWSEATISTIKKAIKILKDNNKYVGVSIGASDEKTQRIWLQMGADMISVGGDTTYVYEGITKSASQLSKIISEIQK